MLYTSVCALVSNAFDFFASQLSSSHVPSRRERGVIHRRHMVRSQNALRIYG